MLHYIWMSTFLKACAAFLATLFTLNVVSVNGAYISSMQDHQTISSLIHPYEDGLALSGHEDPNVFDSSFQSAQAADVSEHPGSDCEGQHPVHHHCHQGHCGFAASFSSLGIQLRFESASRFIPTESSLIGVELAGPRKPPRA